MAKPTWLVTGGAGFLGQAVVRRLAALGHPVRVLDTAPRPAELAGLRVDYHEGDVRDRAAVAAAVEGVDAICHAAAALPIHRSKALIHSVNVDGTHNLLEAAAASPRKPRFVFISSTAVYGLHKEHPITERNRLVPVGPYGASKVEAEALCASYRDRLHVAILRPKTFLGEGRLGVFEILFDWIHDGKRIPLIGKGHNRYQLLDVEDLVDAILLAAFHPDGSDTFNVAADRFGTLREDLAPLFAAAGHPPRFLSAPRRATIAALFVLDKLRLSPLTRWHYGTMSQDSHVETGKARERLGWAPRRSNQETLLAAYAWYHANRGKARAQTGTTHTVAWDQRILKVL
ncbi:MAG TPA: NAD(P)-dependent oxidoreductase, partial [Candidatus Thermoplasmatota archaeon]|nr:NAD(P)-dependent oxidoreductase [Candidatus Thermoplasmatota archaeon]